MRPHDAAIKRRLKNAGILFDDEKVDTSKVHDLRDYTRRVSNEKFVMRGKRAALIRSSRRSKR
jgi:hypothetical protein